MKKKWPVFLFSAAIIIGLAMALYKPVIQYVNNLMSEATVVNYSQNVSQEDPDTVNQMIEQAQAYNRSLSAGEDVGSEYEENSILNFDGMIGYLYIPSIDVYLPIYHGTSNDVLAEGIGHLTGTSFPVGGQSTHSVLAGHTGFRSALMLTNLDKMKVGDVFEVTVLDQKLYYQVDQIVTVLPDEMQYLSIEPDKDYVTLLTCTPYGINSHRLLVRGSRFNPEEDQNAVEEIKTNESKRDGISKAYSVIIVIAALLFLFVLLIVVRKKQDKGKRN